MKLILVFLVKATLIHTFLKSHCILKVIAKHRELNSFINYIHFLITMQHVKVEKVLKPSFVGLKLNPTYTTYIYSFNCENI